jgi:hypothetical protein
MSDTARLDDPPRSETADEKAPRGTIGRDYLEKALQNGAPALPRQIRYILMLSQVFGGEPATAPYPETPLDVHHARLALLAQLSETLTGDTLQVVLRDVQQIGDATVRLPLLAKLAHYLTAPRLRSTLRDIWRQINAIVDPVTRTHTLYALAPLLKQLNDDPRQQSVMQTVLQHASRIPRTEARLRSLVALVAHLPDDLAARTCRQILDTLRESNSDAICSKILVALAPHLPPEFDDDVLKIATAIDNPAELARTLTGLARHMRAETLPRVREVAVDAIGTIEAEDDRADALIEFAPYLEGALPHDAEFPQVLEKALRMTIHITRRDTRARMLVALAPHLTPDLKSEALAAVHALGHEQDRAYLLAQLAPHLPPDMLMASLTVAHAMRRRDARVHALTALAPHLPQHAQPQTLHDALAAASNLPHRYERVQALLRLTRVLPADLTQQALSNALDAARRIDNEHARARALSALGSALPPPLLTKALAAVQTIHNPEKRLNAYYGLVAYLPPDEQATATQDMMHAARQLLLAYKRARALVGIVPHVSGERLQEIHVLADKLDDPIDQLNVYIALIDHVTDEDHRADLVRRAWSRFLRIEDGYDRASSLAALASYLPDDRRAQLPQMILSLIESVSEGYDKATVIALLVKLLAETDTAPTLSLPDSLTALEQAFEAALRIPQQQTRADLLHQGALLWVEFTSDTDRTYALWTQLARQLATLPLPDVLLCLGSLLPVLRRIAPDESLQAILRLMRVPGRT